MFGQTFAPALPLLYARSQKGIGLPTTNAALGVIGHSRSDSKVCTLHEGYPRLAEQSWGKNQTNKLEKLPTLLRLGWNAPPANC